MEIPIELKTRLLSELNFVIQKINIEDDPPRKIYFLSAVHGALERTMRFCINDELLMAHAILNLCYSTVLDRFNRLKSGDSAVPFPRDMWEQVHSYLTELKTLIEENSPTYPALERITRLTYSLTGPGHYTLSYLESVTTSGA